MKHIRQQTVGVVGETHNDETSLVTGTSKIETKIRDCIAQTGIPLIFPQRFFI